MPRKSLLIYFSFPVACLLPMPDGYGNVGMVPEVPATSQNRQATPAGTSQPSTHPPIIQPPSTFLGKASETLETVLPTTQIDPDAPTTEAWSPPTASPTSAEAPQGTKPLTRLSNDLQPALGQPQNQHPLQKLSPAPAKTSSRY